MKASTDQSEVDLNIPFQVGTFAFTFIQLVGIIAVMSQVAWQVFIVFMPVTAACIWYQVHILSRLIYEAKQDAKKMSLLLDI